MTLHGNESAARKARKAPARRLAAPITSRSRPGAKKAGGRRQRRRCDAPNRRRGRRLTAR